MPRSLDSTCLARQLNSRVPAMSRRRCLHALAIAPAWSILHNVTLSAGPARAAAAETPVSLFDGRMLGHWQPVVFGGDGEVRVVDGTIRLERGNDLTGVVWTGPQPGPSYHLSLDAMRLDGTDFFCGLTFPVAGSHCTFIVGGWGGGLVGLSNLEGLDASENETGRGMRLQDRRWYRVAVDVTPAHVRATLDGDVVADLPLEGRTLDVRAEVTLCTPLGLATWRTTGAFRAMTLTASA